MTLLSGFLFFCAGILFHKTWSSILQFGILSNAIEKVTTDLLISLVLIDQDIQFSIENKKILLKEKGMTEEDIEHYCLIHERTYRLWREKVIITLINNYPVAYRQKFLPFSSWNEAVLHVNELFGKEKLASKKWLWYSINIKEWICLSNSIKK